MDYRVMIFMAGERLAAIDIGPDGKTDAISIDGNEVMEYNSGKEIKEFCQYIKNYYNIDAFSDLGMSVFILRFDAVMEKVFALLEEIRGAAEYNVVSVEKLLPWMAMKEGVLKSGTAIQMRTFDIVYTVSLNNDMVMKCQSGGEKEHSYLLPKEKFAECDYLSKNILSGDEEEKNELRKKYEIEIANKEERIKELERKLLEEKEKTREVENRLAEALTDIQKNEIEKEHNANRCICRLQCVNKEKDRMFVEQNLKGDSHDNLSCLNVLGSLLGSVRYIFHWEKCCSNGEIVKKGQKMAMAKAYSYFGMEGEFSKSPHRCSDNDFIIKAEVSGRLFWLQEPETELAYGADIAVIGDVSDTKEETMRWYEKINRGING